MTTAQMFIKKGKAETSREIAKKMKANGVPFEQISSYTGLSLAEIRKL